MPAKRKAEPDYSASSPKENPGNSSAETESPTAGSGTPDSASGAKTGDSLDTDLTVDYGIPHYLYLYYIPRVPDKVKPRLDELVEEIRVWHAYEVGHVERELKKEIHSKDLPTDSSITSRIKRSCERSGLLGYLREAGLNW